MLVGGHAGRQDLRDAGVGDHREAVADGAGGRRVLQVVDLAQGEDEGKHARLVVEHDAPRLAGFHAAEGEGGAGGEAERVDGRDGVEAERHREGVVAQLDALLEQLMDDAAPVDVAGEEDQDAAALQLAHDLDGHLVALGAADDGGKAGHAPIDQLDAPGAQLDVVDGPVEQRLVAVDEGVAAAEVLPCLLEALQPDLLRLEAPREADALDDFLGQKSRNTGVQSLTQVGQPKLAGRLRVDEMSGMFQNQRQIAELLDFVPHEGEDHRQVVGGVGELDRRLRTQLLEGGFQGGLRLCDDLIGAPDGSSGDEA